MEVIIIVSKKNVDDIDVFGHGKLPLENSWKSHEKLEVKICTSPGGRDWDKTENWDEAKSWFIPILVFVIETGAIHSPGSRLFFCTSSVLRLSERRVCRGVNIRGCSTGSVQEECGSRTNRSLAAGNFSDTPSSCL